MLSNNSVGTLKFECMRVVRCFAMSALRLHVIYDIYEANLKFPQNLKKVSCIKTFAILLRCESHADNVERRLRNIKLSLSFFLIAMALRHWFDIKCDCSSKYTLLDNRPIAIDAMYFRSNRAINHVDGHWDSFSRTGGHNRIQGAQAR